MVVYKAGDSAGAVIGTAFHEMLHPLIRGWQDAEPVRKAITDLEGEPLFMAEVKPLLSSYGDPKGCLDELIVHAVATYLSVKAGLLSEARARRHRYCGYEAALYDAIFDRYDSFPVIDDFIAYALANIRVDRTGGEPRFAYFKEEGRRRWL